MLSSSLVILISVFVFNKSSLIQVLYNFIFMLKTEEHADDASDVAAHLLVWEISPS